MLRKLDHDEINLIVTGLTQATLDIARQPENANPSVSARGEITPGAFPAPVAAGAHQLDVTAWEAGGAEESAWRATILPEDAADRQRIVDSATAARRPYVVEYRIAGAWGKQRLVQEHGSFSNGSPARVSILDVTAARNAENSLRRLARYDALTGLPNRTLLLERIAAAASEAAQSGRVSVVIAISISRLEEIKEAFGRATGDELLRIAAMRLSEAIRAGDTVAYLHGSMFVVLLTDLDDIASAASGSRRIMALFSEPFVIGARRYRLSANLGISAMPRNGSDAAALLQAAETATAVAREQARGSVAWFSTDMADSVADNLHTEDELRTALERKEFVLYFQPIVDISTSRMAAVESLVRWNHPTRGLVMPGAFIPVAERSGLIADLGAWVLREACRQARIWHDAGLDIYVSVNLSIGQFRQTNVVDMVAAALAESAIPPKMLELELTESVMVDGFAGVIDTLVKLKLTGVRLSIDDFGTGYSSLSYLKLFPLDTLKIDQSFTSDIVTDVYDRAIVKATLTLAAELKFDCIAEGIETKEQLELLRRLGCRLIQGYYFSRPIPPAALEALLASSAITDRCATQT